MIIAQNQLKYNHTYFTSQVKNNYSQRSKEKNNVIFKLLKVADFALTYCFMIFAQILLKFHDIKVYDVGPYTISQMIF